MQLPSLSSWQNYQAFYYAFERIIRKGGLNINRNDHVFLYNVYVSVFTTRYMSNIKVTTHAIWKAYESVGALLRQAMGRGNSVLSTTEDPEFVMKLRAEIHH